MELKIETIETAVVYINELKTGVHNSVLEFRSGKEELALEMIPLIIDGLQWLSNAVILTEEIHVNKLDYTGMIDNLNEIVKCFENEDYVLLADLFEYELIPTLSKWQENLELVLKK